MRQIHYEGDSHVIDVLLPYYGDGALARAAVESVFAQTSQAWRLIVVDDHSPDPSLGRWLSALDHPQVEYFRNDRNLGVNGNFRRCLQLAKARYVVFLGCDDLLDPRYLSLVEMSLPRHGWPAMVQPRVTVIDEAGLRSRTLVDSIKALLAPGPGERLLQGEPAVTRLLHGAWTYFPAISWRRDALERHPFRLGLETALDFVLIIQLLMDGEELLLLDESAFKYRRHSGSASSIRAADFQRFQEEGEVFAELASALELKGWLRAARAARLHITSRVYALLMSLRALRSRQPALARQLARHALFP